MKQLKYVSNAYIDEDSILHWTEKHWYDDNPTDYTWDVSNSELQKHYDLLPEKICQILLMTDEFHWVKGDAYGMYYPDAYGMYYSDVYHCCWKTVKTKPSVKHIGNVTSNPCYGTIKLKDCDDSVFTKIGKYQLSDYRSGPENNLRCEIVCPRCRCIWAISQYQNLCPLNIRIYSKVMGFFDTIHWKLRVFGNKTGLSTLVYRMQKAFVRVKRHYFKKS